MSLQVQKMLSMRWRIDAEAVRPRPGYDVRRWLTVFPVGMYAAYSFIVAAAAHAPAITRFARSWVGVAVWLVTFAAMACRGLRLARGDNVTLDEGEQIVSRGRL